MVAGKNFKYDVCTDREKLYINIESKKLNYKPKFSISIIDDNEDIESDRLWFPHSSYNLDKLIYGRMYAVVYTSGKNIGSITDETSKIYSWANFIRGYEKDGHINWFKIKNINEKESEFIFSFNPKNKKWKYLEYLHAIEYCIDNGIS